MLNSRAAADIAPNAIAHGDRAASGSSGPVRERMECSTRVRLCTSLAWTCCRSAMDCSVRISRSRSSAWSRCTPITAVAAASVNSSNRRMSAPDITSAERFALCVAESTTPLALSSIPGLFSYLICSSPRRSCSISRTSPPARITTLATRPTAATPAPSPDPRRIHRPAAGLPSANQADASWYDVPAPRISKSPSLKSWFATHAPCP